MYEITVKQPALSPRVLSAENYVQVDVQPYAHATLLAFHWVFDLRRLCSQHPRNGTAFVGYNFDSWSHKPVPLFPCTSDLPWPRTSPATFLTSCPPPHPTSANQCVSAPPITKRDHPCDPRVIRFWEIPLNTQDHAPAAYAGTEGRRRRVLP